MPSLSVLKTLCREVISRECSKRINEPDLVMDDPDKVAAYTRAGLEDGVMAPVYLFHCAQICEIIKLGDTVVDLGCGPATQLAMVARLNPQSSFIGVDLSAQMLERAQACINSQSLTNVTFRESDISHLVSFQDNSVDAIFSTVALHHLPDVTTLDRTFSEISRILKPGGGLYLVDFGHLKSEQSITDFAYQYADRQPELFTLDYLYSLRAAFDLKDFKQLTAKYLGKQAQVKATFVMPYMVSIKSQTRADLQNRHISQELANIKHKLPTYHKKDLLDLKIFFRLGGLRSNFLS